MKYDPNEDFLMSKKKIDFINSKSKYLHVTYNLYYFHYIYFFKIQILHLSQIIKS